MNKRVLLGAVVGISLLISPVGATASWAQSFNAGSFAGGMLGGMLAGAMMNNAQRQPTVVYDRRVHYRAAPRRHIARQVAHHVPRTGSARSAVVNTAADPFATKTGSLMSISTKP